MASKKIWLFVCEKLEIVVSEDIARNSAQSFRNKTMWIIGASSGIGYALAKELDKRGAKIILSARSKESLHELAHSLNNEAQVFPLDVQNLHELKHAFSIIKSTKLPESIIYMAGAFAPSNLEKLDIGQLHEIIWTNLIGVFYLLKTVLPALLQRKAGQLVFCASVMGYRGIARAQPYGASKAALINLAESLRSEFTREGLDIKVINPGFIRTPMTAKNKFQMPALIEASEAAVIIADGLLKKSFEIHFPKRFTLLMKLLRILPSRLYFSVQLKWLGIRSSPDSLNTSRLSASTPYQDRHKPERSETEIIMDEKPVVPFESFAVASWLLLDACMAALPELRERRGQILDRVALMLEHLQVDADGKDEGIAHMYAGARRLIEGSIKREGSES